MAGRVLEANGGLAVLANFSAAVTRWSRWFKR
jgi:hypothetical protein